MFMKLIKKTIIYIWKYGWNKLPGKAWRKIKRIFKADIAKYNQWVKENALSEEELQRQREFPFAYLPLVSIVVPVYNTPLLYLNELIQSVIQQTYSNWELCIADGNSTNEKVREFLSEAQNSDPRIKPLFLTDNGGISANTNAAIEQTKGEYIVFSDHDDTLAPNALFEIVSAFLNKKADFIYSDEDKIDEKSKCYFTPHFKPDFSLDYLRCTNYICHISAIRKDKLMEIGLLNPIYDGSQDHDLNIRAAENGLRIVHVPKILYHWRSFSRSASNSNNEKCKEAARACIQAHLDRLGIEAVVSIQKMGNRIKYSIIGKPAVSVIVNGISESDLNELKAHTAYSNVEYVKSFSEAKGDYLVFIGEGLLPSNNDWITEFLMLMQFEDVGAVGGEIINKDKTVIHRGIYFVDGYAHFLFYGIEEHDYCYMYRALCVQNCSAVDGRFSMVNARAYKDFVIGNPESDFIEYCLSCVNRNKRVVFTPYASARSTEQKEQKFNAKRYNILRDAFYNENMSLIEEYFKY